MYKTKYFNYLKLGYIQLLGMDGRGGVVIRNK